jgi:hypothetical protein
MNGRYHRRGGILHRSRILAVAVACAFSTAFWTFPATAEEAHGTHAETGEKHVGGDHDDFEKGLAPALEVDSVDGHEVWVCGVDFEVML